MLVHVDLPNDGSSVDGRRQWAFVEQASTTSDAVVSPARSFSTPWVPLPKSVTDAG
jgi:hypothetical protein